MYKVAVFDLDGTLIEYESSWLTLHNYFGVSECNVEKNLIAYQKGQISYLKWMELDIALWLYRNPTIDDIKNAFSNHNAPEASKNALEKLHKEGISTYIVSSGIDILALKIASQLHTTAAYANRLTIDKDGYLTGTGTCFVEPMKKYQNIRYIASMEKVSMKDIVCVGDTRYDISMFKDDVGKVALNAKHEEIKNAADASFDSIGDVVAYILER